MREWFEEWFDRDYAAIYAARDAGEAAAAVAMALRVAPGLARGPVLDLACGAGRHLEALRRVNPLAFGLDLSRDLLGLAPPDLGPWLLRADMRALPVREGTLSGICMWFTPFGYFPDAENVALLRRLGALLAPGGVVVLDYLNARHLREHLVPEDEQEAGGIHVLNRRTLEGQRVVKRMVLTRPATGATRTVTESVRLYEPEEMEALAADAGLGIFARAGGYDGADFDPARSGRWIGFLRKVV